MLVKSGLNPSRGVGMGYQSQGVRHYELADDTPDALFRGDPVKFGTDGSSLVVATAGDRTEGVFMGAEYVDADGTPRFVNHLPAGTSAAAGEKIQALVVNDPNVSFHIAADAAVDTTDIGLVYDLNAAGTGDTIFGQSAATLDVASGAATKDTGIVELIRIVPEVRPNASAPVVEVRLVNHTMLLPRADAI